MNKKRIYLPGPTTVPEESLLAQAQAMIGHRSADFESLFKECQKLLQWLLQTHRKVYIFPSAGTGAMEAAIVNLFPKGSTLLSADAGAFSERWAKIAEAHGCLVERCKFRWGTSYRPKQLLKAFSKRKYDGLLLTHNETSTGVLHPLEDICQAVRAKHSKTLILIDAISSFAAVPLVPDRWECDAVVAGSQKALMTPPGLSFLWLSRVAHQRAVAASASRHYFDVRAYDRTMQRSQTPYTPAVSLLFSLLASLKRIKKIGRDDYAKHHLHLRDLFRAGCQGIGFRFLAKKAASPIVTAVMPPSGKDAQEIKHKLKEKFAIDVAGGQGELKGKIFRVGHMGCMDDLDIFALLAALEQVVGDWQGKGMASALRFLKP